MRTSTAAPPCCGTGGEPPAPLIDWRPAASAGAAVPAGSLLEFRALPPVPRSCGTTARSRCWTARRRRQQLDVHQEPVRDVVVAPDGTWAVTAGDGPPVILWDVDPETGRWSRREVLTGHDGDVGRPRVDPAGPAVHRVGDHTIITWDMSPDGGFGESDPGLDGAGSPTARR